VREAYEKVEKSNAEMKKELEDIASHLLK